MAIILYINNEHCTSLDQLKDYFSDDLTPESDIYADLLDYGRHGDLAEWLREMGEPERASKVETIASDLRDSAFYAQLKATITDSDVTESDAESLKPQFNKCFSFKGVRCDVKDNEAKVAVSLKVLMCVNETYELSVSSNWGTRAIFVNPYSHPEGKTICIEFTLRKRPGKDVGEITVKADGEVISQSVVNSGEFLVGDVRFKMIHVEGGEFRMGATREQSSWLRENEKPAHQVTLSNYSIGETPVTQELWQTVMGDNPSSYKGAQRPVELVSWNDCQEFIRRLNQETGKQFRLPTEAEWEYAARGGMKSNGYEYSGSNDINEVAWYSGNSSNETHPVKEKKPNELAIYDMSGNIWEWCQDWWNCNDKGAHTNPAIWERCQDMLGSYTSSSQTNPKGSISGSYRVTRGGCFGSEADHCSLSYRKKRIQPEKKFNFLGFRLALSE